MVPLRAVAPELLGEANDRFHTENQAELVIHLQPVGFHAAIDAGANFQNTIDEVVEFAES